MEINGSMSEEEIEEKLQIFANVREKMENEKLEIYTNSKGNKASNKR